MTKGSFVPLPGSQRETISGVQDIGPVDAGERIEVTLITRRRAELPTELVTGPATISTEELATLVRHRSGRRRPGTRDPGRLRPGGHRHQSRFPPGQGGGHRGSADAGVRNDPAPCFQPRPGRPGPGGAPLPRGPPPGAGRARGDRARGAGAGRPAPGQPAYPVVRGCRGPILLYATAGRAGLPVPGGYGWDRPDDRRPRVRGWFFRQRPSAVFFRPRSSAAGGHGRGS